MENTPYALKRLGKNKAIRYKGKEYITVNRICNEGTDGYSELQWELKGAGPDPAYLACTGIKDAETWVVTRQIVLRSVEFSDDGRTWRYFDKSLFGKKPPKLIRRNSQEFVFDAEHTCIADDDDGDPVKKVTWDYYTKTKSKNLAFEIWKEANADYPEAYLGDVVYPADIEPCDTVPLRRAESNKKGLYACLWVAGIGLFLFIMGFPGDGCLTAMCPLLALSLLGALYFPVSFLLCAAVWVPMAILTMFHPSFAAVLAAALLFAAILPLTARRRMPFNPSGDLSFLSWAGVLPVTWCYSFYLYFRFAPAPHDGKQLFTTLFLPAVITVSTLIVQKVLEKLWPVNA
jgi:hypothetical protein